MKIAEWLTHFGDHYQENTLARQSLKEEDKAQEERTRVQISCCCIDPYSLLGIHHTIETGSNNLDPQRGGLANTLLQIPEVETYIVAMEAIEPVDRSYPERFR